MRPPGLRRHSHLLVPGRRFSTAQTVRGSSRPFAARGKTSQATILHVLLGLFPEGGDASRAEFWTGLRPMTPDGPPVLGPTPFRNLYLNTGHGSHGWTMACGAARVVSDVVSGREPDIDVAGLTLSRFGHV